MDFGPEAIHPGPLDKSVLYMQQKHRTEHIWNGKDLQPLHCRRGDGGMWRLQPSREVRLELTTAGFYGLHSIGHIQYDHALITALIERWRPETNTFHFIVGEATVTLQDVEVLFDLPVEGDVVTTVGPMSRTTAEWRAYCTEMLGLEIPVEEFKGSKVNGKYLRTHFDTIPTVLQQTRAYILMLIGGCLLPDTSGRYLPLQYLPLLVDLAQCGRYSWGSACLAALYGSLTSGTDPGTTQIAGPLLLVQLWAWERLSHMCPTRVLQDPLNGHDPLDVHDPPPDPVPQGWVPLPRRAWGSRWNASFDLSQVTTHVLRSLREQLDVLTNSHFVWEPYSMAAFSIFAGRGSWRTVTPLVCMHMVEWHYPDRVLRQFGMRQCIPRPVEYWGNSRGVDLRGNVGKNWAEYHHVHIARWGARLAHTVDSDYTDGHLHYFDPYMVWYRQITRRYVDNPAIQITSGFQGSSTQAEYLRHQMTRVYHTLREGVEHYATAGGMEALTMGMRMCSTALATAGSGDRLDMADLDEEPRYNMPSVSPPRRSRRRARAREPVHIITETVDTYAGTRASCTSGSQQSHIRDDAEHTSTVHKTPVHASGSSPFHPTPPLDLTMTYDPSTLGLSELHDNMFKPVNASRPTQNSSLHSICVNYCMSSSSGTSTEDLNADVDDDTHVTKEGIGRGRRGRADPAVQVRRNPTRERRHPMRGTR